MTVGGWLWLAGWLAGGFGQVDVRCGSRDANSVRPPPSPPLPSPPLPPHHRCSSTPTRAGGTCALQAGDDCFAGQPARVGGRAPQLCVGPFAAAGGCASSFAWTRTKARPLLLQRLLRRRACVQRLAPPLALSLERARACVCVCVCVPLLPWPAPCDSEQPVQVARSPAAPPLLPPKALFFLNPPPPPPSLLPPC